jgi:DNA-binding response OmpR family regulator
VVVYPPIPAGLSREKHVARLSLKSPVAAAPERVFSRYELVNRIRGYEYAGYERTIDSHVKNLRHKLGASGADVLETVLGVGYRLRLRRDDPS